MGLPLIHQTETTPIDEYTSLLRSANPGYAYSYNNTQAKTAELITPS